ncbi:hypothetical protein MMC20_000257 [Loxospora ochrophaea]|nr:hypothetical protein [Loxospora ochrophaea]
MNSLLSSVLSRFSSSLPHTVSPLPPRLSTTTIRTFSATPSPHTTLNQVRNGSRKPQKARKLISPQVSHRAQLKGVCLKVGTMKPKKPNSAERKIARIRLSNGKAVTAYIQGEGRGVALLMKERVRGIG